MNQVEAITPLLETLRETTAKMVSIAGRLAGEEKWNEAEAVLAWARSLGELIRQMAGGGGSGPVERREVSPSQLPRFYVDRDEKLVMRARSRRGGFYEHRVVKLHYDLIVQKVAGLARAGKTFYSQDLQDRREMPVHEPLLMMRLLTSRDLLIKLQKGKYAFKDAARFERSATELWSQLPREGPR